VNPIFFGRAPKSLFGVYHPPKAAQARGTGIVLCYPFGQEYMRAHRAFRQLAMLLTKAGFHVLRFDYFGTGDSSGETGDVTFAQWVEDAHAAADELKETAEVSRVAFVGLRLGAAVAATATSTRADVDQLVLWDPAVSGTAHLAEILDARADSVGNSRVSALADGTVGVMGFPITRAFRAELEAVDLLKVAVPAGTGRLVVASQHREEYAQLGTQALDGVRTSFEVVPSEGSWNEVDDYGGALIPVFLIQAIVAYLTKEIR